MTEGTKTPRRTRKRTRFKMPEPAVPVRGLWQHATEEERERAHQTAMGILELWLGKTSKGELAKHLQVPPLRVWQLSQLALSGMVCGLLKQPRRRAPGAMTRPEDDPKKLRKRIAELEDQLGRTERLAILFRDLPLTRAAEAAKAAGEKRGTAVQRGRARSASAVGRKGSAAAGRKEEDRGDDGDHAADAGAVAD